jgi:outer membrane protein TolC
MSVALLLGGCTFQQYAAKPVEPAAYAAAFGRRDLGAQELRDFFTECGLPNAPWPPARWDPFALECAGMFFHPDLARARAEIAVAKAQEITAGQRPNPVLNLNVEHHSDTSDDRTPWSIGPSIDVTIERPSRRAARIERAVAETAAAEIDLEARIWEVRRNVRDRMLDYADAWLRTGQLDSQSALLANGVGLLTRREELGLTSDFEVSAMRIEAQRAQLARSNAEAKLQTAQAELATSLGIPAASLQAVTLDISHFSELPEAVAPEVAALQGAALTGRADMRVALQRYAVAEATLKEEIARQYPDITLSPGYFFDQTDNIWSLGAAFVLPLLHRNEGPIAEAQARRELAARVVESVQASIIGEVQTAEAGYRALRQSAEEADEVIAGLLEREQKLQRQFELGEVDRLALVRAELETASARMLRAELLTEVWRASFRLEDATQSSLRSSAKDASAVQMQ